MDKKDHIYGSNIPEARERLHEIAERLDRGTITKPKAAHDIEEIIENLMIRRFADRPAAPKKYKTELTDAQRNQAEGLLKNTDYPHRRIARIVGTDGGRISETLHAMEKREKNNGN